MVSSKAEGSTTTKVRPSMYAQPTTHEMMMAPRIPYAPFLSDDFVSSDCSRRRSYSSMSILPQSEVHESAVRNSMQCFKDWEGPKGDPVSKLQNMCMKAEDYIV